MGNFCTREVHVVHVIGKIASSLKNFIFFLILQDEFENNQKKIPRNANGTVLRSKYYEQGSKNNSRPGLGQRHSR